MRKLKSFIYPIFNSARYAWIVFRNKLRIKSGSIPAHQFLFLLCPPFSGSTLLSELLCTSKAVSTNNPFGTREGQQLPGVKKMMWQLPDRYNPGIPLRWPEIKTIWMRYWDLTKPVLLEKSPPNLVRAGAIREHFHPVYFIVMVRNPYALCASMMSRGSFRGRAEDIANFVIRCLVFQKHNAETLPNTVVFTYEALTLHTAQVKQKLLDFLPVLHDINTSGVFRAHALKNTPAPIANRNDHVIKRLSAEQLAVINRIFQQHEALMAYFGYSLMETPATRQV